MNRDQFMTMCEEAERLAVEDVGAALAATERLVGLADEAGSALDRARARRARAHALCNSGRLEEGWLMCDQAARLADEAAAPVEAGRIRLRSMQALGELGRFDESIRAGESALAAFAEAGDLQLVARAEVNLGIVHQRRDQPDRAVEHFNRARPIIGDDPMALGTIDNNRGEALLALNDLAGAEQAFQSALDHYEPAGAELVAAVAEGNLADLAARQGLLHRAMYHFERARSRFESTGSLGHLARLHTEQAEAISVLGLPQDALKAYETALPQLDRAGQALEAARARAGLGRTLLRLGRLSDAETALSAAALAFEQLGHSTARARTDLIRAELAAARGTCGQARRLIHAALSVLHQRPIESASARHLLARLALAEGELTRADGELGAALAIARNLDLAPLLCDLLHTLGLLRLRQGDRAAAIRDLRSATAQIERVRGTLHAQRFRGAYLSNRLAVYEDLIGALLDDGRQAAIHRALAVAEQAKSRVLLDLAHGALDRADAGAAGDRPGDAAGDERGLLATFNRQRAELNGLYSRLADDAHQRGGAPIDAAWQRAVVQRERRLEEIESRLASARGVAGLYARAAGFEAIAEALPAGTTLLEYVIRGGELLAIVVADGRAAAFRRLAPAQRLDDAVARLQFQINLALRPGADDAAQAPRLLAGARAELAALDRMLLAPLRPAIEPGSRLLVVPHGPLHLLPFHALWNGDGHLIERHEVHYAPSASLYLHLRERREPAVPGPPLVVGVADRKAPGIEAEAARIARQLGAGPAGVLLGEAATVQRVVAAAPEAGVIHMACHAAFRPDLPFGSGVRLADRWLTVRDIYAMRLDAELITLSGCETGRGLVRAGDEHVGLLRGFFAAGASAVLASLWRVDDRSTAETMDRFYGAWRASPGDGSKAAALREAQVEMLGRHPHPAHWAPFRLVGRP